MAKNIDSETKQNIKNYTGIKPARTEKKLGRIYFPLVTFGIVLAWVLMNAKTAMGIFGTVYSAFRPFVLGGFIAYIINVFLVPIEKLWDKLFGKNTNHTLKRAFTLIFALIIVLGVLFLVVFLMVPSLKTSIESFIEKAPDYLEEVEYWWDTLCEYAMKVNIELPSFDVNAEELMNKVDSFVNGSNDNSALANMLKASSSIVSTIVRVLLALVFSIYMLAEKERIGNTAKRTVKAILPDDKSQRFLEICSLCNKCFANFVTGQLTEAVIIGVLCFIGMNIFAMPYSGIISILVGFTALIPIFGAFIGTAIGAFLILLISPVKALWFVVFIIVLQQLEGNLIYPKVVGKSVGLPGILVLVAVYFGGELFGFTGMLLAVPICAVLYTLHNEFLEKRTGNSE